MSILRKIFGPSQKEIWRQLSEQIGGNLVEGGFWTGDKVQARVKEWTVTIDTYVVSNGKSSTTYTRLRAPYVNADGFRFTVYRKSVFTAMGKLFGMQDVEVGIAEFDDEFVIKGTDEYKLRTLFANPKVRALIESQPAIYLQVRDDDRWFAGDFPEGVDELYFQVIGAIKDVDRLQRLFDLFAEVLNHLCHIDSAYENDPGIAL